MRIALPTLLLVAALALVARADEKRSPKLTAGDAAPSWRINDHEGRARNFAAEGKDAWLVLAFFPKADTPG